jgi:hypothetical protein
MKNNILIILLLVSLSNSQNLFALKFSDFQSINYKEKESFVLLKEFGSKYILVPFYFNTAKTNFKEDTVFKIPLSKVYQIYYVKTNHQKNRQDELDSMRLEILGKMLPKNLRKYIPLINFTVISQTATPSNKLFHGFVIIYEAVSPNYQKRFIDTEIKRFESKKENDSLAFYRQNFKDFGYELPVFDFTHAYVHELNRMMNIERRNPGFFNSSVIAIDVTGSMSPYLLEVFIWQKLQFNEKNKQLFVFFNDGDIKSDAEKKVGKVGGIYTCWNNKGYKLIENMGKNAMSMGNGGDMPENNLEAILKGMKLFPDAENIILVADNYATPRDMALLKEIKKPVKVIICGEGGTGSINPVYLELARETKGSVHTIHADIKNLVELKEGQIITLDKVNYKIEDGKFKMISEF